MVDWGCCVDWLWRLGVVEVDGGVRVLAVNVEEATVGELVEMARGGGSADYILFPEYAFGLMFGRIRWFGRSW